MTAPLDTFRVPPLGTFKTSASVMVGRDESDEELEEKAEMLAAADEMATFEASHASWVYKVPEATADKVKLTKKDLVQAKGANAT